MQPAGSPKQGGRVNSISMTSSRGSRIFGSNKLTLLDLITQYSSTQTRHSSEAGTPPFGSFLEPNKPVQLPVFPQLHAQPQPRGRGDPEALTPRTPTQSPHSSDPCPIPLPPSRSAPQPRQSSHCS